MAEARGFMRRCKAAMTPVPMNKVPPGWSHHPRVGLDWSWRLVLARLLVAAAAYCALAGLAVLTHREPWTVSNFVVACIGANVLVDVVHWGWRSRQSRSPG